MSALAAEHGAINLGQGFPDTDGPAEVLEAAVAAIRGGRNQYPPGAGVPELLRCRRRAPEALLRPRRRPAPEVLVTVGATEAIAATVLALCEPGDEVVTFEPYYDSYAATIALAGGVRRTSVLRFPDFAVDEASLRAAFSPRTRLVLLNTPHNPTGKVFTREELELVCALAREHDAWVVTDEVYEHLTFDGAEHVPVATLPGMRERTADDLVGRQDLLDHRVEGRLGAPGRPRPSRRCGRSSSSSRTSGRGRSSRPWQPASACRTRYSPASRRPRAASATSSSPGCGTRASRCRCRTAPTSSSRMPRRWARPTRSPSATRCLPGPVWSGCPSSVFHDDVDAAPDAGPLRLLQAGRRARGGLPAAGGLAGLTPTDRLGPRGRARPVHRRRAAGLRSTGSGSVDRRGPGRRRLGP